MLFYIGEECLTQGSNRTFMELKSKMVQDAFHAAASSNRTFMELKLAQWRL